MAKQANLYTRAPWAMKPAEFAKFTMVTPSNRKAAIILGRTLYVIEKSGNLISYNGFFDIRPQLVRGKMQQVGHPFLKDSITSIPSGESDADYKNSFGTLLDKLINDKTLYFKLEDSITQYSKL